MNVLRSITYLRIKSGLAALLLIGFAPGICRAQAPFPETPPAAAAGMAGEPEPAGVPPRHFTKRLLPFIGVDVGTFVPVSSRTRERFGPSWTTWGIGIGKVEQISRRGALISEINFLSAGRGKARAIVVPLGYQYRRTLGEGLGYDIAPYYVTSVNFYGTFIKSPEDNIKYGLRFAFGGALAAGLTFGERGFMEVRYRAMTGVRGINLSGNEIRAGVRF